MCCVVVALKREPCQKYEVCHVKWQMSLVGNRFIVEGFREFIARFVNTNAGVRPLKNIFRVAYSGRLVTRAVAQVLYGNATISLDRKYALARELCGTHL